MNIILNINQSKILALNDPEKMKIEWTKQVRAKYGILVKSAYALADLFEKETEGFSSGLNHQIALEDLPLSPKEKDTLMAVGLKHYKLKGFGQELILLPEPKGIQYNLEEQIQAIEDELKAVLNLDQQKLLQEYKNLIIDKKSV